MRFVVSERGSKLPTARPLAVLQRDNWDDYHYKSSFDVALYLENGTMLRLEGVKIVRRGQPSGYTEMPKGIFKSLPNDYCSLGQSFSYYERLVGLGEAVY